MATNPFAFNDEKVAEIAYSDSYFNQVRQLNPPAPARVNLTVPEDLASLRGKAS